MENWTNWLSYINDSLGLLATGRIPEVVLTVILFWVLARSRRNLSAAVLREQTFFEMNVIGMATLDREGRIQAANEAFLKMSGLTRDEIDRDQVLWNEWVTGDYPCATDAIRNAGFHWIDADLDAKGGKLLPVLVSGVVTDERSGQMKVSIIDVSDQRKIRDDLSYANQRLHLALEGARMGTWVLNLATGAIESSARVRQLLGQKEGDEPVRLRDFFEGYVHPEDVQLLFSTLEKTIATMSEYDCEFRITNRAGELRWLQVRGRSLWEPMASEPHAVVGVAMDVTDRKAVEESLRQSEAHLKSLVETLNRSREQLQQAKETADVANELKSAFLANMSHEIRTPLGAMLGFADLLKDPTLAESERTSFLDVISRNGDQLSSLINDILDLSKVEAGQLKTEVGVVDLLALIEDVVCLLGVKAREKGLLIETRIDGDMALLRRFGSDSLRIKQILTNVVGNAIKFTDSGKVLVRVRAEERHAVFEIEDTGIGLTESQAVELFQPFCQVDPSASRKFGGTGLGLALSRKLAQAMGGDLVLQSSKPGGGSIFEITLPNRCSEIAPSDTLRIVGNKGGSTQGKPKQSGKEAASLNGTRILLVDDSSDNQQFISRLLAKRGAKVEIASNGEDGVGKALSGSFDVVLMDLQMPKIDGYTATQILRSRGFDKPIIALTAHAMLETREKCLSAGCNDHVTKPVHINDLVKKVAEHAMA